MQHALGRDKVMAESLLESGEDTALGESFGQRRPPLYEMIKNILREYPSGQIFKVSTLESPGITDYIYMPAWLSLNSE